MNCFEMAKFSEIKFLLFVLLMIFPAHALDVIFSNALDDFKQKAEIDIDIRNGRKTYAGTLSELTYRPQPNTTKVIVHIIDRRRFVQIIRNAVRVTRLQIAQELLQWHCELVFLGLDNFEDNEYYLISGFMVDKILSHPEIDITIETIGENHFDRVYPCHVMNIERYKENAQICGGTLKARLRSIPSGALRPAGSDHKEIKLYAYHPRYHIVAEVTWRVILANNTYSPEVNVSDPIYNFRNRHRNKEIYLLILGGKEYSKLMTSRALTSQRREKKDMLREMSHCREVLIVMGVFNFDWTEIDIVTQIILKHSEGSQISDYNVFTYGYGMFNTYYQNTEKDGRYIRKLRNSRVLEIINGLMGEEVKEKMIDMSYYENEWQTMKELISLSNGRYDPAEGFQFTFPWVNQKIAFIVYDSTEQNDQINIPLLFQLVEELKESGIRVVVIKAINFGLDDIHIVAQWIEYHKGIIDSEQIAVLGGGIFDTIFQSYATTFNTFFDTKKNELKIIRNAFVKDGNEKRVFTANIDTANYQVWSYPMNTINGFYEPDLIRDKNVFDTDIRSILFIVTSADNFRQISLLENAGAETSWFRFRIELYYPSSKWRVFLVGLDNFGKRDSHLFAELLRKQTITAKSLYEFVCIFSFGIRSAVYQYKDTASISTDSNLRIKHFFTSNIGLECTLFDDVDE